MKAQLECLHCIMKQAYNTSLRATDDSEKRREIMDETARYLPTVDLNKTPADSSNFVYRTAEKVTGNNDPYKEEKKKYNDICLAKVEYLKDIIELSENPLKTSARIAILGNIIDLGIGLKFDLDKDIDRLVNAELKADDFDQFERTISEGRKKILYLGDNAGEIVFDTLLVATLTKKNDVTYVVKSGPIINDSTMEDAEYVGMTTLCRVIETGSNGIGVKWDQVSDEFLTYYKEADIILSKGQGNFETMSDRDKETYFMLRAKCDIVANMIGVTFGDIVFKRGPIQE